MSKWRIVMARQAAGQGSTYLHTGSEIASAPCFCSCRTIVAVNVLAMDAAGKRVDAESGTCACSSANPEPFTNIPVWPSRARSTGRRNGPIRREPADTDRRCARSPRRWCLPEQATTAPNANVHRIVFNMDPPSRIVSGQRDFLPAFPWHHRGGPPRPEKDHSFATSKALETWRRGHHAKAPASAQGPQEGFGPAFGYVRRGAGCAAVLGLDRRPSQRPR